MRTDRAEAMLLLAELGYFEKHLSSDRMEEIVGCPLDQTFRFWVVAPYPGPEFHSRLVPSADFTRALELLWEAVMSDVVTSLPPRAYAPRPGDKSFLSCARCHGAEMLVVVTHDARGAFISTIVCPAGDCGNEIPVTFGRVPDKTG